jgi:hypothetical protein
MSTQSQTNNNIKQIALGIFTLSIIAVSLLSLSGLIVPQKSKLADASGPNTSNLIIGTSDIGNAVELSVCLQSTPGPIHITNASTWFQFDTSAFTTTAGAITKGQYGNSNNGYGALKWQQVAGAQNGTSDMYTMSLAYFGDGITPGLAGLPMSSTPELFGKVTFAKAVGVSNPNPINLFKNIFYSTENISTPIVQTVSYVNGDCTMSTNVIIRSSSSTVSSNNSSVAANSSSSSITNNNCINGQANPPGCVCPPGQTYNVPMGSNGPSGVIMGCRNPYSSSSSVATLSSANAVTIIIAPNTQVPNISIPPALTVPSLPNNTQATFTFPGSSVAISGIIINNVFIPNIGQIVPNDALAFYGANTFGSGLLRVGSQTYNIPTNVINNTYTPTNSGGSITISLDNKSTQSSQVSKSSISNTTPIVTEAQANVEIVTEAQANVEIVTEAQANVESKNNGVFKSKLKITDPYVCGVGSYGNVPSAKEFGVENVYYDFYKESSTKASYSFKLKLNDNGDFFLPISKSSNVIAEGKYRVVFYALDNEGNKAQGEYSDFIIDNCNNVQTNVTSNSVRTGGSQFMIAIISLTLVLALAFAAAKLNNKEYSISSIFGKK